MKLMSLVVACILLATPAYAGAVYLGVNTSRGGTGAAEAITAWEQQNPTARIKTVTLKTSSNGYIEGVLITYRVKQKKESAKK